ncbi:related to protein-tyrosine-phosphatase [Phialocephala subalpina]|uniref:protein-tyrosine-phosphatase n=1 Tax=Phialocephala subalpina TaxID=576137 RepID=A0A1L7WM63_9HELO|nr:related to protein-tyrosine-phosphatase [Phialocephala subalpina]
MVITSTAARPPPRSSHSHSHSQTHRASARPSTTPLNPLRVAASVGQSLPPNSTPFLRSPGAQTEVRTPSPNYFGLIVDPATDPRDSGAGPKDNWSPPSSSIRSFGPPSPKHLPLDANPDFEAFRRQTEEKHNFNLNHGNLSYFASTPSAQMRPKPERKPTRSETQEQPSPRSKPQVRGGIPDAMELDSGRSPKSLNAPSFFDIPRQQSPVNMNEPNPPLQRNELSNIDDRHPRLSLPQNKADPPSHLRLQTRNHHGRADTLPSTLEEGPAMISVGQLRDILEHVPESQFLLLDLRVFPQFSQSRIQGALNLCIPTTLLKRPSFNLQKLQDTFTNEAEKARFCQWRSAKYLIVYDAFSSEKKDAVSAVNTLKKFSNEGWKGDSYILRGGFTEFHKSQAHLIDHGSNQDLQSSKINISLGTSGPGVAPVAGGCVMPATKNAANPFFSNIRQNQDLVDGVGQMDIKMPKDFETEAQKYLPNWLCKATEKQNHGKRVSDKFLRLELAEKDRMSKALSSGVTYGTPGNKCTEVQIAGIEKGGKNRYNNIWPFEHTRVKLQGRPEGSCDYVNASHIKSSRSNKQYIASQGPLPATFEDFWSVIWDQDVRVIVMLTAESEGGQLKCHPYWAGKEYGPMKLKALSEKKVSLDTKRHRTSSEKRDSGRRRANTTAETVPTPPAPELPYAIIRKFTLAHAAHPFSPMREITQIHYSSWPDFGAPASPAQLLGLVELSNMMQRATLAPTQSPRSDEPESDEVTRPVLVHCSAGCGRTGTFCTIDSVIDMLKRQRKEHKSGVTPMEVSSGDYMGKVKEATVSGDWVFDQDLDLIERTVEDFRGQRISMVQSLRQYVLCYETVLEWIAQQQFGTSRTGRDRSGSDIGVERRQ